MKLALALTFVASALANAAMPGTRNCVIPGAYTVSSGTTCTSSQPGYLVYGVCLNFFPRVENGVLPANEARVLLDTTTSTAFSSDGTVSNRQGCVVPNPNGDWTITAPTRPTTVAGLAEVCTFAPAAVTDTPVFQNDADGWGTVKGVAIECAAGFFPVRGFQGTNICINWDGDDDGVGQQAGSYWPDAPMALGGDYFAPPAFLESFNATTNPLATHANGLGYAEFSGLNALRCARGCLLPTAICNNGRLSANIIGTGNGFNEGTCTIAPVLLGDTTVNQLSFQCITGLNKGTTFVYQCGLSGAALDATPPLQAVESFIGTPYVAQCGTAFGAQTVPLWNLDGNLNGWESPILQAAGEIENFPTVTSTLRKAYTVNGAAYFTPWGRRHWNNNEFKALVNGAVYEIIVLGCDTPTSTVTTRAQCVQQTLNWWRCHYNFPFYGGTLCYSDFTLLACPTHELGFRCPSSSKKGLLGLLGLLGLIPLFLLCCCLLFLCCIRRRKTEADVHFATFDPHAAPVIATAPCATATACPTAFGATPFATHPSAIPCL